MPKKWNSTSGFHMRYFACQRLLYSLILILGLYAPGWCFATSSYKQILESTNSATTQLARIRARMPVYEKYLTDCLSHNLRPANEYTGADVEIYLSKDPLACRLCEGASSRLREWLKIDFPEISFQQVRSPSPIDGSIYHHDYLRSRKLNLIIDSTYRQYFHQIPADQFARLPRIFVGTPAEYKELFATVLDGNGVRSLMKARAIK